MTRFKKSRADYPDGVLAIYDNGGRTADRYCVVFAPFVTGRQHWFTTLNMNDRPYHPQGIGMTGEHAVRPTRNSGDRVISIDAMPPHCRQCVEEYLRPDVEPAGGPGYPGPCPESMDWSAWLAFNNVD
jgi:hypothetical protein